MSPLSQLSLLALASAVVASPHGHGHANAHKALHTGTGSALPYPYPSANATAPHGSSCRFHKSPAGSSAPAVVPSGSTSVLSSEQATAYETVIQNVNKAYPSSSNAAPVSAADNTQCPAGVTVTNTEKVYVTVTAGQPSSSSPVSAANKAGPPGYGAPGYGASSSEAAPAPSSAPATSPAPAPAPVYSAPAYSSPSSSVPAPVSSAPPAPPAPSSVEITSSSSAWAIPSISIPDVIPSVSSSSAPSASPSTPAGGKRGLLYNQASLTDCFSGSKDISWGSNWLSTPDGLSGFKFIPTLHSAASDFTSTWSKNAQSAIDNGASTLFSFNEPDIASQANMAAADAAAGYVEYMNPFAGKAQLCAPAVSSSENEGQGLSYLKSFVDACKSMSEPCHIDALAIHWYGDASQADLFKQHLDDTVQFAKDNGLGANGDGNVPIWVNEFGCSAGSDEQISSFLEEVMPYMDNHSSVAGYAYFYAENGYLVSGTSPSTYGNTYMSYSS